MKSLKLKSLSALIAASLMMGAGAASAAVVGGGATLPQNLYNDVLVGTPLPGFNAYIGVGSGKGKTAFFNNDATQFGLAAGVTVDYAGSDSLVSASELSGYNTSATKGAASYGKLIQIPAVLTSVTVPYNVPGVTTLDLTSEKLALIFSGAVTNWNDPLLAIPGAPNLAIKVIYRSDSSGTTEIFARHLNNRDAARFPAVSSTFATAIGKTTATLPANFIGANGSGSVPTAIAANPGSIGYVSPDFANPNDNAVVAKVNGLLPTQVNVQAAIEVTPLPANNLERQDPLKWGISNANPSVGYSFVASTNLILSQCYQDALDNVKIRDALSKLYGTAGVWDTKIATHGFIPLPANWKAEVLKTFHNQADALALAVGHPAECTTGRGRPN